MLRKRFQPAVGVEDVVLSVVHGERIGVVGSAFSRADAAFLETGAGAQIEALQRFLKLCAIGGEILIQRDAVAERDDRDQVGRLHLLIDIVLCRYSGTLDFVRLHRREIKEQDDQPPVLNGLLLAPKAVDLPEPRLPFSPEC